MSRAAEIDADRVISDLRELARRTSDADGAQRVAWTPGWHEARSFLQELLGEIGFETETDEAGNVWGRLAGRDVSGEALVVGSHLDSVPSGGWLDGALGVMAGVGVLRAHADTRPPRPLVLVDWADEEGARFGLSLFGSSAFAGTLDADSAAELRDTGGRSMREVLAESGVDIARAPQASGRHGGLGAYLELHIEQGPVLEAEGAKVAAVEGCQGIERHRFDFRGQTGHAGTTPMRMRRDAGLAAAACASRVAELPDRHGGVATTGELRLGPGISTAVPGAALLTCDLRNPEAGALGSMLADTRRAAAESAAEHGCTVTETPIFAIEPTRFDQGLVSAARQVCGDLGETLAITSGALHDAASVARVMPAAMLFCPSLGGISHAKEEDTAEDDLRAAIRAFGALVDRVLSG